MLAAGGFFCEWESFDGGWPSIFYIGGALCLVFCVVWYFVVYDTPMEHPRISDKEKKFITAAMEATIKESVSYMLVFRSFIISPKMMHEIVRYFLLINN